MPVLIILLQVVHLLFPVFQTNPPIWMDSQQTVSGFPESITFQASFSGYSKIEGVSLVYGVDQDTCGEVEAIAYPGFEAGKTVEVQWTWDMRQSGSIPPGARIWWKWVVQDELGKTLTTEKQTLIWLDDTHDWQTVADGQISLHYYYLDYSAAIELLNHATKALDQLTKETAISTDQPIDLYIYANTEDMRQSILYEPGWTGGLAYPENNIVLIGISPDDLVWGKSTIAHELTHLLVGDYSFSCLGFLPTWLQEGLAVLGEGGPDSGSIVQFEEAKTGGNLLSFNILSGGFSEDPDKANLSYSQSYYMVNYLVETYGREKISRLLKTLARGEELSAALDEVYGFDLAEFEKQWRQEIGAPLKDTDVGVSQATPTRTIIPTIIPLQGSVPELSATPRVEPTGTITPIPTVTQESGGKKLDTRPFVFLFLALTCLIGIIAIALLIILIARGVKKKHIATVLLVFLLGSGIPFLTVRGDDSTPTPYPPYPTATPFSPEKAEDGTYFNPAEGLYLKLPASVQLVQPDGESGSIADFNFADYSIWGFLFTFSLDPTASLEENASTIVEETITGFTNRQTISSKAIKLPSGVDGWYTELVAYNPVDNTNYQLGYLTIKGNLNGLALVTFSTPDYYNQYRSLVDELHQSLEIRPSTIAGFNRKDVLILEGGETSNPRENDPATSHSGSDNLVFSGLVTYNTNMEVIPDLANTWEISPDGKTYTFHLNPGAVFHNGRPVTAQDVIFSWERAAKPITESDTVLTYLGDIVGIREMREGKSSIIQGLKAIDNHTLQVTIDAPKPYFLQKLTYPTTFVVDKENVALGEDWYRTPNGTGPFRLARWDSMSQKVYERFEEFYGPKPEIKGIIINLYSGDSTRLYESGNIDLTGIATFEVSRFTDPQEPMSRELHSTPNLCTSYITLDVTRPPFDNLKVRQAFAMAIDRDLYIRVVLSNAALPAHGLYPPALPGYDITYPGLEYNPEKAQETLREAGFTPDKMPEIVYSSAGYGSSISSADAALIQMWEQNLGIKIKVQNIEPEYYLDNLIDDNTGQISQEGWCADYPDPENFADVIFHSGAEMNTSGYSNPELDAILEQARVERDVTSRIKLYQQAERIIVEDVPAIFLSHSISYTLVKPYIQGYVEAPMAIPFERYLRIDPTKLPNP